MLYKSEFETRRKKTTKTWADFGDDLRRLTDKVFPNLQFEARQELALSHYLDQLDPPHFAVKQCRPKNLSEAVSSTIELELYLLREQSVCTVKETEPATTLESQVAPIQAVSDPSLLQQLLDHIEKLETSGPRPKQLPRAQQRPLQPYQQNNYHLY